MQNLNDQYRRDSAVVNTLNTYDQDQYHREDSAVVNVFTTYNLDQYPDQGLACPSFSTYSSASASVAAEKVTREFKTLNYYDHDMHDDVDDGFEFVSFQTFNDNDNVKVFPVFNRDLINDASSSSSSSSEAEDELEGVPAGSYCVWVPKTMSQASSPSHCKKSNSTGSTSSSRKWRLRDLLLRRSNSEGGKKNDAFVLLTPALTSPPSRLTNNNNVSEKMGVKKKTRVDGLSMAHEVFYVKGKEGYNKRQSYLPYRRDLVGFFASVNAMGKAYPNFSS